MTEPDAQIAAEVEAMNAPIRAQVTWTPHSGGPTRTVSGAYLDSWGGQLQLGCGIEALLDDLGLPQLNAAHQIAVCELVDAQLREGSTAEVRCPDGAARLVVD